MSSFSLSAVLAWHRRRYALLKAQDIYKLVHQGVFGPGHIISSAAAAHNALVCELATLQVRSSKDKGQSQEELAVEPIEPENRLVRVNLRPMLEIEGEGGPRKDREGRTDAEWLVEAMVESAQRVKGDPRLMKRRLAAAVRWCRTNLPGEADELERISAQAEESGYPAFHHSAAYTRAYLPAYRVILSDFLKHRALGRAERARRPSRAAFATGR